MNEREKFKKCSDLFLAMSEGEELRYKGEPCDNWPIHDLGLENYTTVKKEHPLQCLVGTQILCEFTNSDEPEYSVGNPRWGLLHKIYDNDPRETHIFYDGKYGCETCTPVKDYWNDWRGGECPAKGRTPMRLRFANMREEETFEPELYDFTYDEFKHASDKKRPIDTYIISVMYLEDS